MNESTSITGGPVVVHKVFIPFGGDARTMCGLTSGRAVMRNEDVTCPHCLALVVQDADDLSTAEVVPAEEVELIRADDLAVVEVVRVAGAAPAVRFSAEGRVDTWTANRAMAAAAALVTVAEQEVKAEDGNEEAEFLAEVVNVAEALITAARLVRAEVEAAA